HIILRCCCSVYTRLSSATLPSFLNALSCSAIAAMWPSIASFQTLLNALPYAGSTVFCAAALAFIHALLLLSHSRYSSPVSLSPVLARCSISHRYASSSRLFLVSLSLGDATPLGISSDGMY